jgi:hypothetical protein
VLDAVRTAKHDAPHRNLQRPRSEQAAHGLAGRSRQPKVGGKRVGSSHGQHAERNPGADHGLQHFVHGAVAAADEHCIASAPDGLTGQRAAAARAVDDEVKHGDSGSIE